MTMQEPTEGVVAIVDYGLGNLFSVRNACEFVGLKTFFASTRDGIEKADAIILPGVGAFGDAMRSLVALDLVSPLRDAAECGRTLVGICLGAQLMMEESEEFGVHQGLGIFRGRVRRFENPVHEGRRLKVPQVGWNRIDHPPREQAQGHLDPWAGTMLENLPRGVYMYFVHSFILHPDDPEVVLSMTSYGNIRFCSSMARGNVFACQFHPERSGVNGLRIYQNLAVHIQCARKGNPS